MFLLPYNIKGALCSFGEEKQFHILYLPVADPATFLPSDCSGELIFQV